MSRNIWVKKIDFLRRIDYNSEVKSKKGSIAMKIKEIVAVAAAMGIFVFVGCNYHRLFPQEETTVPTTATEAPSTVPPTTEEPTTLKQYDFSQLRYSANSAAAACYDCAEQRFLYEKNASARIAPASLTKIVTVCVALQYADPSVVYTVGDEVNLVQKDSSLCFIRPGHQVTLYDLLCGMLLVSGNDAAYTVAVNVARAVSGPSLTAQEGVACFVGLMNDFAQEHGMTDSHFVNPEGWDDPQQYMSARDIAIAADYAMGLAPFREIIAKTAYHAAFVSGQTIDWTNSNQMIDPASPFFTPGVVGGKTGTTQTAGKCLLAVFQDDAHSLIAVSMGNPTEEERFYSVRELFDTVLAQ